MSTRIIIICLFPLIFTGCTSSKKKNVTSFNVSNTDSVSTVDKENVEKMYLFSEVEARRKEAILLDVPIPLYVTRIPVINEDMYGNQIVLGYQSNVSPDELITMYREQMERHGWNLAQSFKGSESLLHFEKPTRVCSVCIRPHKKMFGNEGSELIIYVEDNGLVW